MKATPLAGATILPLVLLGGVASVDAGAWTQPRGAWYVEVSSRFLTATTERDYRGRERPIFAERIGFEAASYMETVIDMYAEYGLVPDFTLIGKLPYKVTHAERTERGAPYFDRRDVSLYNNGLSDLFLGGRVRLWGGRPVSSLEGGIKIPLGYDSAPDNGGPPLGNGEVDVEARLLLGSALGRWPAYVSGGAGYRFRGGVYHDEILYEGEVGFEHGRWFAQIKLFGIENIKEPHDLVGVPVVTPQPGGGGQFQVVVGDQNVMQWEPSVSFRVRSGFRIRAGFSGVVAGKNTVDASSGFLSITFR